MAKECKIIQINDGSGKVQQNKNFHLVTAFDFAAEYINRFLSDGWEVKHMVPEVSPAIQGEVGSYVFYKAGWTFFLERDRTPADADLGPSLIEEVVDFDQLDEVFDELFSESIGNDEASNEK